MERQWNGKNVLVTGAENEIGRAVARMFASHGARIAVAAPVREEAEKVVAEISESGGEAIAFSADPADVDQVRRMVRCVTETLGSIDILVNNAGGDNLHAVGTVRAFSESEPAQWAPFLESVLRGTIATIRYVLPQMIVRRTGRIVNLVSVADALGRSPSVVSRMCVEIAGQTFTEMLTQARMEMARHLLNQVEYHVYDVSEAVGYTNAKNFTRAYKKYWGCTPRELRSGEKEG